MKYPYIFYVLVLSEVKLSVYASEWHIKHMTEKNMEVAQKYIKFSCLSCI